MKSVSITDYLDLVAFQSIHNPQNNTILNNINLKFKFLRLHRLGVTNHTMVLTYSDEEELANIKNILETQFNQALELLSIRYQHIANLFRLMDMTRVNTNMKNISDFYSNTIMEHYNVYFCCAGIMVNPQFDEFMEKITITVNKIDTICKEELAWVLACLKKSLSDYTSEEYSEFVVENRKSYGEDLFKKSVLFYELFTPYYQHTLKDIQTFWKIVFEGTSSGITIN